MKLFGLNITLKKDEVKQDASLTMLSRPNVALPTAKEKDDQLWISFGEDNLYPEYLVSLLQRSAIHRACVWSKATMIAGKGIEFIGENDLSPEAKARLTSLKENPNGTDQTLHDIVFQMAYNTVAFGAHSLELIKSIDGTKYTQLNNIDVSNLRSGKYNEYGKIDTYYYCKRWADVKKGKVKPKAIHSVGYDENDRNSILYFKKSDLSNEYYGLPDYHSAINWIEADAKAGELQLNNVSRGYQPSLLIKFFKKPDSPEKEDEIVRSVNRQYAANGDASKVMVMFSNSVEDSPEVVPMKIENIDEQLISLAEQSTQQILTANRITSPSLLGIPVPSGLAGGGTELESAYKIFDGIVITPEQIWIERSLQRALMRMGIMVTPRIVKLNPLSEIATDVEGDSSVSTADALGTISPLVATKILETMSPNEVRDIIGLKPITGGDDNKVNTPTDGNN